MRNIIKNNNIMKIALNMNSMLAGTPVYIMILKNVSIHYPEGDMPVLPASISVLNLCSMTLLEVTF